MTLRLAFAEDQLLVLMVKLRCLFNVIRTSCLLDDFREMSKNAEET